MSGVDSGTSNFMVTGRRLRSELTERQECAGTLAAGSLKHADDENSLGDDCVKSTDSQLERL